MATPTPNNSNDMGQIEHEIAQVRSDVGRTVQEIGSRLTPAHLMEQAKRSLKDTTTETTRAVAQSASDAASTVAARTRDAAMDARDQVQAHPYTAGAIGVGLGLGYWLVTMSARNRKRLVPREWDQPFDRSSRRSMPSSRYLGMDGGSSNAAVMRVLPVAAAATAAWLIWKARA
jgi:ElaB/YqjD/DUF883 family membrane-anchored ribosome-binding protein